MKLGILLAAPDEQGSYSTPIPQASSRGNQRSCARLYTWGIEPHWLEFTYPDLPIVGLPHELDGRTLAQISDLHVGPKVDDSYIIKSLLRAGELMPDFVVFTGDWITYRDSR